MRVIRLFEALLHGGTHVGGWTTKQIHQAVLTTWLRLYRGRFFARGPEGGHRMTDKIETCAAVLHDAAMERAHDDPDLARADFESFCNVMWTDDCDMECAGLTRAGCDSAKVVHKPRLLSDNGSSYISSDLAEWLKDRGIAHVRGAPCHPQTQGKIERWHQTLKNRILLENYYLPGISKPRSHASSSTTITGVTMKTYRT